MSETTDFLIVGGGSCGLHASGRNSGVLHAGFYYTADSLKARFSRDGNRELTEYCLERGLRINRCGKLVVARSEGEQAALEELFRRARTNGVEVERLGEGETARLEPTARTVGEALYSPTTSTVEPREVVASLARDAAGRGVEIRTGEAYLGREGDRAILTSRGRVSAGYLVNAAGLYADRVARDFGFASGHRILPFKGLYLYPAGDGRAPRMHVYPVPALDYPFLGVHWTATVDGRTKIGPTAIPALWREHYKGLANFRPRELVEIGMREADLWLRDSFGFRRLAWQEIQKRSKRRLVSRARELAPEATASGPWRWGSPGVRAQLLDLRTRRLEMDFRTEGDALSFHILNAVSPAFTCAFPFARHVADEIEALVERVPKTVPAPMLEGSG